MRAMLPQGPKNFHNFLMTGRKRAYTGLAVSVTVIHWDFLWYLQIINTRGYCRLLRHRRPTSSQHFIKLTNGEVELDWLTHRNLYTQCSSYKPEAIVDGSTFNFIFINN